jgi:hypothetical protein
VTNTNTVTPLAAPTESATDSTKAQCPLGHTNPAGTLFCGECGAPVFIEEPADPPEGSKIPLSLGVSSALGLISEQTIHEESTSSADAPPAASTSVPTWPSVPTSSETVCTDKLIN